MHRVGRREPSKVKWEVGLILLSALSSGTVFAQTQGQTPPPPPPQGEAPASPPSDEAAAQVPTGVDPEVAKSIESDLAAGTAAVRSLDLVTAQRYFEAAFSKADSEQVQGPLLAQVYMSLGALFSGYLQQIPQGTEFFKMGFQLDPEAEPRPALMNSKVQDTLAVVREAMGIAQPKAEEESEEAQQPANILGGFWVIKHEPVTEAKRMYPLGLYVETNPMVAIKAVRLYFRLPSDRQYQVAYMKQNGPLFGMLIECDAIALIDPKQVFYYIEVIGGDNSIISTNGSAAEPNVIEMVDENDFDGAQPTLPGLPPLQKCNPEAAAPCPPWDPHCKDVPCVTNEDCIGDKVCSKGFCVAPEKAADKGDHAPIGIVISGGVGIGAGVALGKEDGLCENIDDCKDTITLDAGFSPSWMFTRLHIGYFILDNLILGGFVRFQHLRSDEMKIAGLMIDEVDVNRSNNKKDAFGPMVGLTASLFLWGDGRWFGPGQLTDELGNLADKQGLRAYSRFEFNFYGAMYHELTLSDEIEDGPNAGDKDTLNRQHASGLQGAGLGAGVLYGLHKYFDLGFEIMYDFMFPTIAHNFDGQLFLQVHF